MSSNNKEEDTREDFCGACIALPLAMAGAGLSVSGGRKKGDFQKYRKLALWGGLGLVLISIIIGIYYFKTCSSCR